MKIDLSPAYPQPFFELQLVFARKVAEISYQPFDQALLHCTALYRILGLGGSLDPTHPVWQRYLQKLQHVSEQANFTYQFYLQRYQGIPKFTDEEHWGCFAYEYLPESQSIQIHFSNQETSIYGPLSRHRRDVRLAELRAMFQQIKQRHPDALLVQGGSWLYNWEAYRRLFPLAFGQSVQPEKMFTLTGRNVWGQFLRRNGGVHQETSSLFLERVSQMKRMENYPQCFPYPNVRTEAPIQLFHDFYRSEQTIDFLL